MKGRCLLLNNAIMVFSVPNLKVLVRDVRDLNGGILCILANTNSGGRIAQLFQTKISRQDGLLAAFLVDPQVEIDNCYKAASSKHMIVDIQSQSVREIYIVETRSPSISYLHAVKEDNNHKGKGQQENGPRSRRHRR
jgi:hypothetical protein